MSKKNSFDDGVKAISALVEMFQQQREIANKKVVKDLISAVSSLPPKNHNPVDVTSEYDKEQKLVDILYSTNSIISFFKKEIDELKRNTQRQLRHQNQNPQKYIKHIAEKKDIIGILGLALS